jgi:hypothetical protein
MPKENHMKTFETSRDLLLSNSVGQGKTDSLPDFANLEAGKLTYSGHTVEVTQVWQDSYLLMNLHRNLKDLPAHKQQELLNAYSENRLSLNHKFDTVSKPVLDKPLPNHYLSSDQQRLNYFELTTVDTVASIYHLLTDASNASTKDNLLALIKRAKELIITAEQAGCLAILEAKESALIDARTKLEKVGCTDITFISETSLTAIASYGVADKIAKEGVAGLIYDSNNDKLLSGQIQVSFELEGGKDE